MVTGWHPYNERESEPVRRRLVPSFSATIISMSCKVTNPLAMAAFWACTWNQYLANGDEGLIGEIVVVGSMWLVVLYGRTHRQMNTNPCLCA